MFYSTTILSSKATLGRVWIAGTYTNQKISKKDVSRMNLIEKAKCIMEPPVPLSLRVSSHLMFGVTRCYWAKYNYFHEDCTITLTRFRMANVHKPDAAAVDKRVAAAAVDLPALKEQDYQIPPKQPTADADVLAGSQLEFPEEGFRHPDITLQENVIGLEDFEKGMGNEFPDITLDNLPEATDLFDIPGEQQLQADLQDTFLENDFMQVNVGLPELEMPDVELPAGADMAPLEQASPEKETAGPKTPSSAGAVTSPPRVRPKRKREQEIIVDERTDIPKDLFKTWLEDVSDISIQRPWKRQATARERVLDAWCAFPTSGGCAAVREFWKAVVVRPRAEHVAPEQFREEGFDQFEAMLPVDEPEVMRGAMSAEKLGTLFLGSTSQEEQELSALKRTKTLTLSPLDATPLGSKISPGALPELVTPAEFPTLDEFGALEPIEEFPGAPPVPETPKNLSVSSGLKSESQPPSQHPEPLDTIDVWAKRMLDFIRRMFDEEGSDHLSFDSLTTGADSLLAARSFSRLLALQSNGNINIRQSQPYADVLITPGPYF